jgi:hypothetical protein
MNGDRHLENSDPVAIFLDALMGCGQDYQLAPPNATIRLGRPIKCTSGKQPRENFCCGNGRRGYKRIRNAARRNDEHERQVSTTICLGPYSPLAGGPNADRDDSSPVVERVDP